MTREGLSARERLFANVRSSLRRPRASLSTSGSNSCGLSCWSSIDRNVYTDSSSRISNFSGKALVVQISAVVDALAPLLEGNRPLLQFAVSGTLRHHANAAGAFGHHGPR